MKELVHASSFTEPCTTLEQTTNGVLMRCYVQQLDWIARVLLGFDCPIEIIAPNEMRDTLRDLGQKASELADSGAVCWSDR